MSLTEIFGLFGGIGLFLYGMTIMSTGLRNACGDHLRVILEKATRNRVISVFAGIAVTVLVQSSSATDVMVIGFVSSGLMGLTQAIGVIMGANIGTTITAQITAFNIGLYAPLILFLGAVIALFVKNKTVRDIGTVVLGFGMLFVGVSMIKSTIAPLAEQQQFQDFVSGLSNPVLLILFGIIFTALLQSSSSSTVIFQAFAMQGIISYNMAVYLIIGAAIGSVTPNLLASLTVNRTGKRCAILNLLFNLMRAALILILISAVPQILTFIQSLSPDNIARQIANTHTIFAIISVLILLPFSKLIVALSEKIIPKAKEETRKQEERKLVYLTQIDKLPIALVLDQAHREITRLGEFAIGNLNRSIECFFSLDQRTHDEVMETEETVDYLTHSIMEKLVHLRGMDVSPKYLDRLYRMIQIVDDMERISDHAENIAEYEELLASRKASLSETALQELRELSDVTMNSMNAALNIFRNEDITRIEEELDLEQIVDDTVNKVIQSHISRMLNEDTDPRGGVIFTDMSIDLERCSDHAVNIATALQSE